MGDNIPEEHRAKLDALASTLADSVHVAREELRTAAENLAELNHAGAGGDADLPWVDFVDASAAIEDARRHVRAVSRIVKVYRRDLDAPAEAPPGEAL